MSINFPMFGDFIWTGGISLRGKINHSALGAYELLQYAAILGGT